MYLSEEETTVVLQTLSVSDKGTLDGSLKQALSRVHNGDLFRVLCGIVLFLEEGRLSEASSRLAALYWLAAAHSPATLGTNPFLPYLSEAACDGGRPDAERAFILRLLSQPLSQVGQGTAQAAAALKQAPPHHETLSPRSLQRTIRQRDATAQGSTWASIGASSGGGILPPHLLSHFPGDDGMQRQSPSAAETPTASSAEDPGMLVIISLLQRGITAPLLPADQQQVAAALQAQAVYPNSNLLASCGLSPELLPGLVEHNPGIAVEAVTQLLTTQEVESYLGALAFMPMSLHSVEVVNRLAAASKLPPHFLQAFISHCIASCQSAKDNQVQGRLVRLLCVFLQAALRSAAFQVAGLAAELQAFCIHFSRIRYLKRLLTTSAGQHYDSYCVRLPKIISDLSHQLVLLLQDLHTKPQSVRRQQLQQQRQGSVG